MLATGVAVATWPDSSTVSAEPAGPVAGATPSARADGVDRTSRDLSSGRSALSGVRQPSASAVKPSVVAPSSSAKKKGADQGAQTPVAPKPPAAKAKAEKPRTHPPAKTKKASPPTPTKAQLRVKGHRYARVALNVRTRPASSAHLVSVLSAGSKVSVTRTTHGAWTLVIHRGQGRWVHTQYLSAAKPKPAVESVPRSSSESSSTKKSSTTKSSSPKSTTKQSTTKKSSSSGSSGGISTARCSSGSGMESGLRKNAIKVHRAVCARYPSVKAYGGRRSGGDSFHTSGRAVDIMIPNASTGRKIADWVRANRKSLGVSEVIWSQHIWTVQRSSEGWRSMSDRGNATANHYDHVHVSVY